jgi:hypothetical protein
MRQALLVLIVGAALVVTAAGSSGAQAQSATPQQLAVLEEILARPEFRAGQGRGLLETVLDPIRATIRAVGRELLRWLDRLFATGGDVPGYVGLVLALAIALGAGTVVLRLARGTLAAEAELARSAPGGPPRAEAELARASVLAAAGDFRAATHHRYLAVLRHLDERGLLRFDGSLTNREHLVRAATNPAVAATLGPLVAEFDQLWYGQRSCSAAEYARFATLAGRADGGEWA